MNNCSIPSTHAERKITVCSHKHSFTLYPSLGPYSWTDRILDRETNTLAARELEELFFQLCHCVTFFLLWQEIVLGVTYLPFLCLVAQVSFLFVAGKCFWCYFLTDHTSCALCQFFCFWREIVFGCTVSKKDSYSASLRER